MSLKLTNIAKRLRQKSSGGSKKEASVNWNAFPHASLLCGYRSPRLSDWITALPWNESTTDNMDIKRLVLFWMKTTMDWPSQKRIIDIWPYATQTGFQRSYLMLVGPPGTGKHRLAIPSRERLIAIRANVTRRYDEAEYAAIAAPTSASARTHYPGTEAADRIIQFSCLMN